MDVFMVRMRLPQCPRLGAERYATLAKLLTGALEKGKLDLASSTKAARILNGRHWH